MILALKNEDLFVIPIDEVCAQIVGAISQVILAVIVGYRGPRSIVNLSNVELR